MTSFDREALRGLLVDATGGCDVQHDGWPCNTCFHALVVGDDGPNGPRTAGFQVKDLSKDIHDYWESVLGYRGDYPDLAYSEELLDELYDKLSQVRSSLELIDDDRMGPEIDDEDGLSDWQAEVYDQEGDP